MRTLIDVCWVLCVLAIHQTDGRPKSGVGKSLIASPYSLCQPIPAPNNGTITCGSGFPFYDCIANCDAGYVFPDGGKSTVRRCDNKTGEWLDPPGQMLPQCQPISSVTGLLHYYPTDIVNSSCRPLPAPNHGTITCGFRIPFYKCTATCDPSYVFPNNTKTFVRECDEMYGDYFGENIPDCELNPATVG